MLGNYLNPFIVIMLYSVKEFFKSVWDCTILLYCGIVIGIAMLCILIKSWSRNLYIRFMTWLDKKTKTYRNYINDERDIDLVHPH